MLVVLMVLVVLVVLLVLVVLVALVALVVLVVLNLESGCGDCHDFAFFSRSLFPRAKSLRHIRSHPALQGAHRINQTHNTKIEHKNFSPPTRGFPNTSKRGDLL